MFDQILKDHNVILIVKFGSHLYGTNTPESDEDYTGIYLPDLRDVMLNRVPKTINFDTNKSNVKNSADDVDFELYSLHYFFELAKKGETVAIDMLHANNEAIVYKSPMWDEISSFRANFYTTNMKSLVGYARKQAAKYGLRGSRLTSAYKLRDTLTDYKPEVLEDKFFRLKYVFGEIEEDEHITKTVNDAGLRVINFCGKQIQETVKVSYALEIVDRFIDQYGHRAKAAQENDGVDWKALSHAVRAATQLKEILQTGDLVFPLHNATMLTEIKAGILDFNHVSEMLDVYLADVERLSATSTLPTKVDIEKVDNFLLELLMREYDA